MTDAPEVNLPPHGAPPRPTAPRVLERAAGSPIRPKAPGDWAEALLARADAGEELTIFQRDIVRELRARRGDVPREAEPEARA